MRGKNDRMKYKIIGAFVGFLFLPTIYLLAIITEKFGVSSSVVLSVFAFTLLGYFVGKLIADD